jgi:hypothetical protein
MNQIEIDLSDRPSSVNDIGLAVEGVSDAELKKLSEYFEKSRAEIQKVTKSITHIYLI